MLLAPDIQEAILDLPAVTCGRDPITERRLRNIVAEPRWTHQLANLNSLPTPPLPARSGSALD